MDRLHHREPRRADAPETAPVGGFGRQPLARPAVRALALGLGGALIAQAGAGQGLVRGAVTALGSGAPVSYASVELQPLFPARFADGSGRFAFTPVPAGQYRLVVRQIGYVPYDAALVVGDSGVNIFVALQPLFVELPPVTVSARAVCTAPGAPDPAREPELAALFDQLRENAARFRVLAAAYPFRYWIERVLEDADSTRVVRPVSLDTLEYSSLAYEPYAPGRVVRFVPGPRGRERVMRLPTLRDLADSVFHRTHCFRYAGVDTVAGRPYVRLDFRAADNLRSPDVDGSALLHAETRVLYRLSLTLTRPAQAARGVRNLSVEAIFGELLPTLVVPAQLQGITTVRLGRRPEFWQVERQQILRVEFTGAAPPR